MEIFEKTKDIMEEVTENKKYVLTGVFQSIGKPSICNGRTYPKKIFEKHLKDLEIGRKEQREKLLKKLNKIKNVI